MKSIQDKFGMNMAYLLISVEIKREIRKHIRSSKEYIEYRAQIKALGPVNVSS
jgi:hypothetical protein